MTPQKRMRQISSARWHLRNLSSGAGYAVSVAREIETLLQMTETLLRNCDCESACHSCLKHYRNQYAHGMLDRLSAVNLLDWGIHGHKAAELPLKKQIELLSPLVRILDRAGYHVWSDRAGIFVSSQKQEKEIVVYPAMWTEPVQSDNIYVSDACLKYAKPYAVRRIMDSFLGL